MFTKIPDQKYNAKISLDTVYIFIKELRQSMSDKQKQTNKYDNLKKSKNVYIAFCLDQ